MQLLQKGYVPFFFNWCFINIVQYTKDTQLKLGAHALSSIAGDVYTPSVMLNDREPRDLTDVQECTSKYCGCGFCFVKKRDSPCAKAH